MSKTELLSVLKMTEAEQAAWLLRYCDVRSEHDDVVICFGDGRKEVDIYRLAFELRDRAVKKDIIEFLLQLREIVRHKDLNWSAELLTATKAKPIEIIIASLIVLEESEAKE